MKIKLTISKIVEPLHIKNDDGSTTEMNRILVKEIQRNQFDDALIYCSKIIPDNAKKVIIDLYQQEKDGKFIFKAKVVDFE